MENLQQDTASPDSGKNEALPKEEGRNRAWNYIKSRVNKDNWFGSLVLLVSGYRSYEGYQVGMTRRVDGKLEPDKTRAFSYASALPITAWSFFSKRGGSFPKGDTAPQRVLDAIKHPQESSSQFEFLLALPVSIMGIYNSIEKGIKAYGIGLKPGERVNAPEKVRLYSGALALAYQGLLGYGHFRDREKEPVVAEVDAETENRPVRRGFLGTFQKIWRSDRVLLIGGILETIAPFLGMTEGFLKKKAGSGEEASHLLKNAVTGAVMKGAYDVYTFQRIAHSNFNVPPESKPTTMQWQQHIQTAGNQPASHTDKITLQRAEETALNTEQSLQ